MHDEKNILHGPAQGAYDFKECLGQLILHQIKVHGSNIAQINAHTGEVQTFSQLLTDSIKLAIYFEKAQVKVNDRIAICSENRIEFSTPLCAALYIGATVCPLNPLYSEREFKHALNISRPKYIFVSPVSINIMQQAIKDFPWSPKLIMLYESETDTGIQSMKKLISSVSDADINKFQPRNVSVNHHVAAILYSSGTTGLPKGVMLSDKNILTSIQSTLDAVRDISNRSGSALSILPFFHSYCFAVLIVRIIMGIKSIILSRFDEKTFLRTIEKYQIESLALVPPLLVFLAKHPLVAKYNLSCVKEIWCGAAPLSEKVSNAVEKRLNIEFIGQGYGLTETTFAVLRTPNNMTKHGSVGKLTSGTSAKVIPMDENAPKVPLGPNSIGELCFKGNQIMKGYCDDANATDSSIDKDGWFHTGDVGYYDKDGFFYIVDRVKELIKYKGYQVPPAELEAILLTHPGIKDAAVIGMPDEEAGELPVAFVVKQDQQNVTEQDIHNYVNGLVSNHKKLRGGIRFVENIPKTASGKILRKELRNILKSKL